VSPAKWGYWAESWLMVYPGSMMLATNPKAMYTVYPLPKGVDGKNMRTVGKPTVEEAQIPGGKIATMKYTISGAQTVHTSKLVECVSEASKGRNIDEP
jgi:hypothetical protein